MVQRIVRVASALAAGNIVYVLAQLLLPPAFIAAYGINGYGEWLALSAGVSWMQTLDCGVQTFLVNELSIQFQRDNLARVRQLQSVALRISIAILVIGLLVVTGAAALVPVNVILGLTMSRSTASLIVILLAAEILLSILWGQLNGMIRSFGYPHRAEFWAQLYSLILVTVTCSLVFGRAPLWTIPSIRLLAFFLMTALSLLDLYRFTPHVFPKLSSWDNATAKEIIRPSLWFGSFTLNQFLVFQAPVLVLNALAGKPTLVAFSVCRSFYGVVRQLAQIARSSVSPEFTRLAGLSDVARLRKLFGLYEGLSLTVGLVGPTLAFIAAPKLVPQWTRTVAISIPLFAAMMVTSVLNVGKDTRLALLQATNTHVGVARFCLITYTIFAIGCIPCAYVWGSTGIVLLWMVVEILQLVFVHRESRTVLPQLSWYRLGLLGLGAVMLVRPAWWLGQILATGTWLTAGAAIATAAVLLTIPAASLFGLGALLPRRDGAPAAASDITLGM